MPDGSTPAVAGNTEPKFNDHTTGKHIPGMPEPNPCPFCKKIEFAGIVEVSATTKPTRELARGDTATYHVQCDQCGAEGPSASSQLEAAELWNAALGRIPYPLMSKLIEVQLTVDRAAAVLAMLAHGDSLTGTKDEYVLEAARELLQSASVRLNENDLVQST